MTDKSALPSPPTNPRWVKITVIALIALVWLSAVIAIVRGESWVEAGFAALIATLCLSAVDLGIDLSRRRKP
ncbi:MAG: hypothetical protein FD125_2671 [bacterium]|nr:MAG: hypothetical protein FD125_2671 [bacterium]